MSVGGLSSSNSLIQGYRAKCGNEKNHTIPLRGGEGWGIENVDMFVDPRSAFQGWKVGIHVGEENVKQSKSESIQKLIDTQKPGLCSRIEDS
jgi:hypothetical protein